MKTASPNYPWLMLAAATLSMMISNGLCISGITVFDEVLLNEFSWERSTLKLRGLITFALAGVLAPVMGVFIDRIGVRRIMMLGYVLLAVCFALYSQLGTISDPLTQMYLIHGLFGLVLVCCGLNVSVILASSWFVRRRGFAIGMVVVGTSIGGMVFPPLGNWMIDAYGWRSALGIEVAFALAMLALVMAFVRNAPSASPQGEGAPSDDASAATAVAAPAASTDSTLKDALGTVTFWAIAFVAMSTFFIVLGFQDNLFLAMRDMGYEAAVAAIALSVFYIAAIAGKLLCGVLADVMNQRAVLFADMGLMVVSTILLVPMDTRLVWAGLVGFGFGWGGFYTLLQLTVINRFGLMDAGKILGAVTVLDALGGGLGIWLTAVFYEMAGGTYQLAYQIFVGLLVFATLALTQVRVSSTPAGAKPGEAA